MKKETYADRLKRLMKNADIQPAQLAKETGLTDVRTVSNWTTGKAKCPYDDTLKKIADFFGVTMGYLRFGEERLIDDPFVKKYYSLLPNERLIVEATADSILAQRIPKKRKTNPKLRKALSKDKKDLKRQASGKKDYGGKQTRA